MTKDKGVMCSKCKSKKNFFLDGPFDGEEDVCIMCMPVDENKLEGILKASDFYTAITMARDYCMNTEPYIFNRFTSWALCATHLIIHLYNDVMELSTNFTIHKSELVPLEMRFSKVEELVGKFDEFIEKGEQLKAQDFPISGAHFQKQLMHIWRATETDRIQGNIVLAASAMNIMADFCCNAVFFHKANSENAEAMLGEIVDDISIVTNPQSLFVLDYKGDKISTIDPPVIHNAVTV